ncbi:autotransporter outer membrane beta-barrel domain-containing protein [Pseudomonas prosekii]|uniref:autotransporter outer membrane beta-barrel domain-containing protein n=1 Tax=Pseudomonas prosekii TaxID=1148509 RepID=UPI000D614B8C|nr:autotransporter outer membrane beta-barrel domain-containing protein [Pseudomonas prosekii]PWE38174.1 autotransporter outer membrane beta-barrel domain-containing protein [Pseudomonas prosekii]
MNNEIKNPSRFYKPVSMASCLSLLILTTGNVCARSLDPGETETVTPGSAPEAWYIPPAAVLNLNGADALEIEVGRGTLNAQSATTAQIDAFSGATVNLIDSTVVNTTTNAALSLLDSRATITTSSLNSQGYALTLARDLRPVSIGSSATITNSTLTGELGGGAVTSFSSLNLIGSRLEGTGTLANGLELAGGHANVSAASQIVGSIHGVEFQEDSMFAPTEFTAQSHLTLDNSSVQGRTGAAIRVDFATPAGQAVLIDVLNGSSLIGGNGHLLEVVDGAAARLQVDNSKLAGDIDVAAGGSASVQLRNSANLVGNLINVDSVTVDSKSLLTGNVQGTGAGVIALDQGAVFQGAVSGVSDMSVNRGAQWNMVGSNALTSLNMDAGSVRFGSSEAFNRLDVARLSGNGQFLMDTDLATGQTDFLNVTESATGSHQLLVAATGSEPVTGAPVMIGNIAAGDAVFTLQNGQVDVGAYAYKLMREGEGLFLQPDKETPSTGTQSALAIAGTAPTVIYAEMTTLNTRLGDRRMTGNQPTAQSFDALDADGKKSSYGLWMRTYGNSYNVKNSYGDGYKQNQTGVSIGVDAPLPIGDGQWLIGAFGGYSKTDLNLKRGSAGSIDSVYLGSYLTWFDQQTGYYVDTVAKINRFNNDVKVSMSDGTQTKADFDNIGVSASVEVGKHIVFNRGYFIEPSVQVGAAIVEGKDYALDNGLEITSDETRSLLGNVGLAVGREIVLDDGSKLQPRLRAAVTHEFINNNRISANGSDFKNDLSSTNVALTGGLNYAPAAGNWQIYAEVGTSRGTTVDQEIGGNLGVSFNF